MKKIRLLLAAIACTMMMTMYIGGIRVQAVTVDIRENYDAEKVAADDNGGPDIDDVDSPAETASSASTTASTAATTPATTATTPAATTATSTAATTASTIPNASASTSASVTPTAASTASTATTDLPKTGDDNRIMITFIILLASFSVFMTTLLGERFGRN